MKYFCIQRKCLSLIILTALSTATWAIQPQPLVTTPDIVQPLSHAELQKASLQIQQKMDRRIALWGQNLSSADFERTWRGKQLTKAKRQEVCGIYQDVVDDMYALLSRNQARLTQAEQQRLEDRNAFIHSLGFTDNLVDTQMGFNCRLR